MASLAASGSSARGIGDPGLEVVERAQRGIQRALGIALSDGRGPAGVILGPGAEAGSPNAGRLIQRAKRGRPLRGETLPWRHSTE
eukprot:3533295-Alexandrium_andersonii.AAC.1